LEQEKAIVSPIPGTTRDIVEGDLSVHGVPLHLLDTAGIRDASDVIENLGVERSEKAIEEADLVILVLDASREELTAQEKEILEMAKKKKFIVCYNKEDLAKKHDDEKLYISALKNDVQPLKEAIFQTLSLSDDAFHKPSLSNPRQLSLLRKIKEQMLSAKKEAENGAGMDIISLFLQAAYNAARSLLGKGETNDLQDEIFSRFCVGK
jgi:tRNA modification GTPase